MTFRQHWLRIGRVDAVKRYVEERSWTRLPGCGAERTKALGIKESGIERLIAESRTEQRRPSPIIE